MGIDKIALSNYRGLAIWVPFNCTYILYFHEVNESICVFHLCLESSGEGIQVEHISHVQVVLFHRTIGFLLAYLRPLAIESSHLVIGMALSSTSMGHHSSRPLYSLRLAFVELWGAKVEPLFGDCSRTKNDREMINTISCKTVDQVVHVFR